MKIGQKVVLILKFVGFALSQAPWAQLHWNGREFVGNSFTIPSISEPNNDDPEYQEALQRIKQWIQRLITRFNEQNSNQDPLGLNNPNQLDCLQDLTYDAANGWLNSAQPTPPPQVVSQSRLCDQPAREGMISDGIYSISANGVPLKVYCEINRNGGNWLVFQRRQDGSMDFYRGWLDYKNGFGQNFGEFWIAQGYSIGGPWSVSDLPGSEDGPQAPEGDRYYAVPPEWLNNLHEMTRYGSYTLRVDLQDFQGNTAYAEYSKFSIGSPAESYPIFVQGYSGNAGDSLSYHSGYPFTTKDRDSDYHYRKRNCAVDGHGAWWYNSCQHSNLNGRYLTDGARSIRGIVWYHWKFDLGSMQKTTMKIKSNQ